VQGKMPSIILFPPRPLGPFGFSMSAAARPKRWVVSRPVPTKGELFTLFDVAYLGRQKEKKYIHKTDCV
jgi:hypothetical protein